MSAVELTVPQQLVYALRDSGQDDAYVVGYLLALLEVHSRRSSELLQSLEFHLDAVLKDVKAAA